MTIQTIIEGLENLKCINGAMYFGAVEFPCEGRETGECCKNEQTYKEAIDELHTYLQSQLSTLLDEIEKQVETNKKPRLPENIYMGNYKDMSDAGYNQAIEEVLSILNKYR